MPVQIRLNYSAGDAADQNKRVANSFHDLDRGIAGTNASLSALGASYSAQARQADAFSTSAHKAAQAAGGQAKDVAGSAAAAEKAKASFSQLDAVYGNLAGNGAKAVVVNRDLARSIDPITGAVLDLAGGQEHGAQAAEVANRGFREFKHVGKDMVEIASNAAATNTELGAVIRSSVNPAFLAAGVAALGVGYAIEQMNKAEEEAKKHHKESADAVVEYAKKLVEAREDVLAFTRAQQDMIATGKEIRQVDLRQQLDAEREAYERTGKKIEEFRAESERLHALQKTQPEVYAQERNRLEGIDKVLVTLNRDYATYGERLGMIRRELHLGFSPEQQLEAQQAAKRAVDEGMKASRGESEFKLQELGRQREQFLSWMKEKRITEEAGKAAIAGIAQQETKARWDALQEQKRDFEAHNRERIEAAKRAAQEEEQQYREVAKYARDAGKTSVERALDENERRQQIIRRALAEGRGDALQNKAFLYRLETEHTNILAKQSADRRKREDADRTASALAGIKVYEDEEKRREQIINRGKGFIHRTRLQELREYRDQVHKEIALAEVGSKYRMDLEKIEQDLRREILMERMQGAIEVASAGVSLASAVFGHNKAIAYAETIVNTARAVMAAAPNYVLMAINAAIGAVQLAKISSTNPPTAKFHGGIDRVPDDVTALIKRDEMVIPSDPAREARELVARARENVGAPRGGVVNVRVQVKGPVYERQRALRGLGRDVKRELKRAGIRLN